MVNALTSSPKIGPGKVRESSRAGDLARIIRGTRCQRAFRLNSRTLENRTASLPKRGDLGMLVTTFDHHTSRNESSSPHE